MSRPMVPNGKLGVGGAKGQSLYNPVTFKKKVWIQGEEQIEHNFGTKGL